MKEFKTVIWLTIVALCFRLFLYFLFANEIVISPDPMDMCIYAQNFASGNYYGVLSTYWAPIYPLLIGVFTLITHSTLLSTIIISVVTGCLVVPLTYYLIRQSFEKNVAILGAIIAVFFPPLINSLFSLGTENLYLLFITSTLIVGWNSFKSDSAKLYFYTGMLVGLSYLTRPEAFGYIPFFVVMIFSKSLWEKKLPIGRKTTKQILTLLFGFSLLATPYILYLKHETGTWTISGKISANTIVGDFDEFDNAEASQRAKLEKPGFNTFIKYFVLNLIQVQKSFSRLVPTFLFIIVGLGLFVVPWNKEQVQRETYLIFFCILTILGYAASVVQERYFYVLLPIFFGWFANGIIQLQRWFQESVKNFAPNRFLQNLNYKTFVTVCLLFFFIYVLPINFFMRTKDKAWEDTQYEERDAGLWLKENGNPNSLVFSAVRRPVYYSGLRHLPYTTKTFEETLQQIKDKKVDYIITSDRSLNRNPTLTGFTEVLEKSPDFELIYERTDRPEYKISIFKVK